jgi:superfamily II DNA or RNA helicase
VVLLLDEQGIEIKFDDKRIPGTPLDKLSFIGELRSDQQEVVERMGQYDTGILHAPTAFGKTLPLLASSLTAKSAP